VSDGGNNNGRLDHPTGEEYAETLALWEQVSKAGFIQGAFVGCANEDEPSATTNQAPQNAFNSVVTIGRTADYEGINPIRLHVVVGRSVPAAIMRELDVKLDDGVPTTGTFRAAKPDADLTVFAREFNWGGREHACLTATPPIIWDVTSDAQDCNGVLLF
jgi:hypothetical protein